ncbi:hypothetical protein [Roseobacter sp. HKCCA0434]|uniref:hypothetical protein n=1 Tax=Roseobacter sp. HKCCA0434 TaxID=3079297 RepID=UPI002905BF39|nr:hypothetical protein [Roseobacter sp. HKCCA0434]
MTDDSHIRIDGGEIHAQVEAGGFVPLELVLDGAVIARPVPRPLPERRGWVEVVHPLPSEHLRAGINLIQIRRQGEEHALATLPVTIGDLPEGDLRAEMAHLRAELELVKSVLRERLRRLV